MVDSSPSLSLVDLIVQHSGAMKFKHLYSNYGAVI